MKVLPALTVLVSLASVPVSLADPTGQWDAARTGCTCHGNLGLPPEQSTTRVFLAWEDGTVIDPQTPAFYVPGESYDLAVWVVGAGVPGPVPRLTANLAGFNLEVTGGRLDPASADDPALQIRRFTECARMTELFGCIPGSSVNDCSVVADDECPAYDPGNAACAKCPRDSAPGLCRPCDDTVVLSAEATHTESGTAQLFWRLRWTAPAGESAGPVHFYLAGNAVNGNNSPDDGDMWTVIPESGVVVPPAP